MYAGIAKFLTCQLDLLLLMKSEVTACLCTEGNVRHLLVVLGARQALSPLQLVGSNLVLAWTARCISRALWSTVDLLSQRTL